MTTSDDGYERALSDLNAHAERLEADLRSKGEECRHYAEKANRLESERDSWRRISERLEAENKRLREAMAGIIAYDDVALTDERAADHAVCTARAALEGGDNE